MADLLEKDLVYRIVACAMKVHNTLGCGFREKTYENALCVELRYQNIVFNQQYRFPVGYRETKVDEFIPDLLVEERIIVETKTVDRIVDEHRGTILNYLKVSKLEVGLIINFELPRLEWERLVMHPIRK